MEKIINYKLKHFLQLQNVETINQYLTVLEHLQPISEVANPAKKWYNRQPKLIKIPPVKSLTFGEVTNIRQYMNEGTIEGVIEGVSIVTKIKKKLIYNFTIVPFYGIINSITQQLIELANMEYNELHSDDDDIVMIEAQASERMAKYGTLNIIDSLAEGDILRWKEIEKLPYMVVFTKLMMDKTRADIMKDVRKIQERKNKK